MFDALKSEVQAAVEKACRSLWGVEPPRLVLETPPRVELGDLAIPAAFDLAKVLRRAPRKIAEELAPALELSPIVARRTVEGGGFVNLHLNRAQALAALLAPPSPGTAGRLKTIVEHTNINPNKAAHIGHLRNAVLGDTLVRVFRRIGREVEVQNYIDDTGVQVADVVVGLTHAADLADPSRAAELGREIREALSAFPDDAPGLPPRTLGDLAWDLYALVGKSYGDAPALEEERRRTLHAVEAACTGGPVSAEERETADLAGRLSEAIVRCHLHTMARIGVTYDVLPRESDILAHAFWARAFALLKTAEAVHLESEGKNAGCWVMRLEGAKDFEGMEDADKILVRSNGTVTYTGKDVAYQLWKLGVLGADFGYEPVPYRDPLGNAEFYASDGGPLWRTCPGEGNAEAHGRFGHGSSVINVIDVRQSYPQKVVREAVRRAGFADGAERSVHFAYEMVALTPAAAEALHLELSEEDRARPFIEMSGRKGLGVKADDLLDRLVDKADEAVRARAGGEPVDPDRASAIAVGALRVYMTRTSRNKVIAFDFDDALAFEGDTGPYLQYAAVRAANIFRKLEAQGLPGIVSAAEVPAVASLDASHLDDALWDVVRTCLRTEETLDKVAETLEVSLLVRHAFAVAGAFHHLYHTHPIVQAPDGESRRARRAALQVVLLHLQDLLDVLGVPVPERM